MAENKLQIVILGLGYVGLPLAVEFGKKRDVIGFDVEESRIQELISGKDRTQEISPAEMKEAKFLKFTNKIEDIRLLEYSTNPEGSKKNHAKSVEDAKTNNKAGIILLILLS